MEETSDRARIRRPSRMPAPPGGGRRWRAHRPKISGRATGLGRF
jgi:hypothetical protein